MTFPPIAVRQPLPFDIVDVPVRVCGVGTGFEGQFSDRVLSDRNLIFVGQVLRIPV
jgi:hypothetical protein